MQLLQGELSVRSFDGIISLDAEYASDGFRAYASASTLSQHLLEPALTAAEETIPRSRREVNGRVRARNGIICERGVGVLTAPPKVRPRPFEIALQTPQGAPQFLQEQAFLLALSSILSEYRRFIAYARNL